MNNGVMIRGERALIRKLDRMAKQSQRNKIARPAVRKAAAEVRKAAKRLAPVETGELKRSITTKVETIRNGPVYAVIGPENRKNAQTGRNPANYAHLVENGTKPHRIVPTAGKKALAISSKVLSKRGTKVVASGASRNLVAGVDHPGSPPQPFMRPAFDGVDIKGVMSRRMWQEIAKNATGVAA